MSVGGNHALAAARQPCSGGRVAAPTSARRATVRCNASSSSGSSSSSTGSSSGPQQQAAAPTRWAAAALAATAALSPLQAAAPPPALAAGQAGVSPWDEGKKIALGPTADGRVRACGINPNCVSSANLDDLYGPPWRAPVREPVGQGEQT